MNEYIFKEMRKGNFVTPEQYAVILGGERSTKEERTKELVGGLSGIFGVFALMLVCDYYSADIKSAVFGCEDKPVEQVVQPNSPSPR